MRAFSDSRDSRESRESARNIPLDLMIGSFVLFESEEMIRSQILRAAEWEWRDTRYYCYRADTECEDGRGRRDGAIAVGGGVRVATRGRDQWSSRQ